MRRHFHQGLHDLWVPPCLRQFERGPATAIQRVVRDMQRDGISLAVVVPFDATDVSQLRHRGPAQHRRWPMDYSSTDDESSLESLVGSESPPHPTTSRLGSKSLIIKSKKVLDFRE